jgi:predicted nucleic acid-binding protein
MIVVADTSPLNYLLLIDAIELLPSLYEHVLIPQEVHNELLQPKTPAKVRTWASSLPAWCEVRSIVSAPDAGLAELDPGERDAIQLALDTGIDILLIDESVGRREALRRNLLVTGTVAILEKGAQRGLIDFHVALSRLDQTTFRLSARVRSEFIERNPGKG